MPEHARDMRMYRLIQVAGTVAGLVVAAMVAAPDKPDSVQKFDHFVTHVSTVPPNAGGPVRIPVRERVLSRVAREAATKPGSARAVLFVHGGFSPSVVAYDLYYIDYIWCVYVL